MGTEHEPLVDLRQAARAWTEAKQTAIERITAALDCSSEGIDIVILEEARRETCVTLDIDGALAFVSMDEVMRHEALLARLGVEQVVVRGYDAASVTPPKDQP